MRWTVRICGRKWAEYKASAGERFENGRYRPFSFSRCYRHTMDTKGGAYNALESVYLLFVVPGHKRVPAQQIHPNFEVPYISQY